MALISAKTILTSLSLFHITLAYFFFVNPASIADQALVYVLGEAMSMPNTAAFDNGSPVACFLAIVLLMVGLSDLVTLSMPEEIWLVHYWGAQSPLRALIFGALAIFIAASTPARGSGRTLLNSFARADAYAYGGGGGPGARWEAGGWDGLRNRVFFAFAFLEMISWLWAWVTLREEADRFSQRKRRRGSAATAY